MSDDKVLLIHSADIFMDSLFRIKQHLRNCALPTAPGPVGSRTEHAHLETHHTQQRLSQCLASQMTRGTAALLFPGVVT